MKLAACTMYFCTGFHFVCSLALRGEVLLYGKINDMLIRFYAKISSGNSTFLPSSFHLFLKLLLASFIIFRRDKACLVFTIENYF
jgi:hypothetical protein